MFDRLRDVIDPRTDLPRILAARCARTREGVACTVCQDACPRVALWADRHGALHLDEDACLGCGACATACPSAAIEGVSAQSAPLRRAARGRDAVTVGCRQGGTGAPSGDVAVACLAALHREQLATLMLERPSLQWRLDLSRCGSCPLGALRPAIEREVAHAAAFVKAAGVTPNVELLGEAPDGATDGGPDGAAAGAAAGPSLSRRALFGAARDQAAALIVTAEGGRSPLDRMPPHRDALLTAVRRRFADAAEPRPELPVEDAFYLDWRVSDACDGCATGDRSRPACVAACPTDAWRLARPETPGGGLRLSFDPAACLGTACSRCATACPRDALEARPVRITAEGGRRDRKVLPVHRCRSCRTPIHAGGTGLCANCRKRQALVLGPPAC